ncbi:hypothetical protein ACFQ68_13435 [Amycolatopsis japonica]|uniref:hypothetical protein n=1 Tax=Amycolatopsis japonica TaxID=208439 RepID=UPI00366FDD0F
MPNKSLSVAKEDEALWARGEQVAKAARQSMSGYVLSLIERDVASEAASTVVDGTELCQVAMHAPGKGEWRESFTGKWIGQEFVDASWNETGMTWRLAITAAGRLVAYRSLQQKSRDRYDPVSEAQKERERTWSRSKCESLLLVFDDLDEMVKTIEGKGFNPECAESWAKSVAFAVINHHRDW